MPILVALICFPLLAAIILLAVRGEAARSVIVIVASIAIAGGAISLVVTHFPLERGAFPIPSEYSNAGLLALELALAACFFACGIRGRRPFVCLLATLQASGSIVLEALFSDRIGFEHALSADKLSVIMALIVGVVGGLIAVYSLGYLRSYHEHHREFRDRRRFYQFLQFAFLSAMFGVLFSDSLALLHAFWEATTLCSFLLIGYDETPASRRNAFLALNLNMLGGLAFSGAIIALAATGGPMRLDSLAGLEGSAVLIPAALLAFAGLVKSAQLPFSPWMLGAMAAPTPASALLHSSTMVKAGAYLVVRLAPVLSGTLAGVMVALVGGLTFLLASLAAVSQADAKRVLAWSTIANLGLIVLCGGVGTYEAVWAAILLILFHAITKALMFLCVGTFEQTTGTRTIEGMSGLILSMPRLSIMMQIGIAGMFLAPFGMLVSKWAVLRALVDYNPLLAVFVVFGSAATLFFWVKWMGMLVEVTKTHRNLEGGIAAREWIALGGLAALTVALCGCYPLISSLLIEPYVMSVYGRITTMSQGNLVIMSIMLGLVALFPFTFFVYGRRVKVVEAYLGGANADSSFGFQGAGGEVKGVEISNYYLGGIFGERTLLMAGVIAGAALVLVMFGVAL
ncbi:MAG: proton-conducting transporter membrane subunit [Spirochaetes bacterium]|nr:proton-conducting transporter membrane subunit [Spirochaetota bacterium]